jgi:hypothetical protein
MTKSDAARQLFHPVVRHWFLETFGRPTAAQAQGWPAIARGESVLILAPTGSGKTLAAYSRRTNTQRWTFLPEGEPERTTTAKAVASQR